MTNPFEELEARLGAKIDAVLAAIEKKDSGDPARIPLRDFLTEFGITKQTAYAWRGRGLICMEKVGGRQYVRKDSISIVRKYRRAPVLD